MDKPKKTTVSTIIVVTTILLIIYLMADYFNIPTALGINVSRINFGGVAVFPWV